MSSAYTSWIGKFDPLAAMQAGAHLGLGVRQANLADQEQADREQSAADQLQLHYGQLAQQVVNEQQLREQAKTAAAALELHRRSLEQHQQAQEKQASENAAAMLDNRNLNREIRQQNADSAQAAREATIEAKNQQKQMREHSINFWTEWDGVSNPATVIKKYPWSADEPGVRTALNQWAIDQRARAGRQASQTTQLRREQAALQKRQDDLNEDEKTRLDQITKQIRTGGQQGIPIRDKKTGRTGMWIDDGTPMPDTVEAIQLATDTEE